MSATARGGSGRDAELHTLTGAYALHALGERERARFERHLTECTACTQEVQELSATAGRLGLAVSEPPSTAMKAQVLQRIATVRQEPPTIPGMRPGGERDRLPVHRVRPAGRRRLSRFVLAACVAGVAAFGGYATWQQRLAEDALSRAEALTRRAEASTRQAREQAGHQSEALADVLAAPDVRTSSATLGSAGATGTVALSHDRDRAVFLATGLPRPDAGKVYQLWFADGTTMRPAGLLASSGSAETVLMEGAVGPATGMGVTVEPAGGSSQPTSQPLALLDFP
ncbi:anti-sigma factor domain-containing protein [Streptomyces sp. NPDC059828]|uniref:anti-sigma factor n=1 Tax=Streptomyces sp. NPDC059828 TaxID=3346965 RepID=UPI00365A21D2